MDFGDRPRNLRIADAPRRREEDSGPMVASQSHPRSAIRPTCSTVSSTMKQSCRLPNTPPIRWLHRFGFRLLRFVGPTVLSTPARFGGSNPLSYRQEYSISAYRFARQQAPVADLVPASLRRLNQPLNLP